MEEEGSGHKGYQYIASPYHRDDRDHRVGEGEGIKIDPVGHAEEDGNENDVPPPFERCRPFAGRIPEEQQDSRHDGALVDVEPDLDGHHVEPSHQVLVVEATRCSGQDGYDGQEDPFVVREVDSFLLA